MEPNIEANNDAATEVMLPTTEKMPHVVKTDGNEMPKRNRKESLGDFLKELGSVRSLPEPLKNKFSSSKGIIHQCIATLCVLIISASAGEPIGFSAILLPQLYVENSTMQIDLEMGSWIASVHSVATPIGSMMAGPMMEKIGRLRSMQVSILPVVIGWILIAVAKNMPLLFVGRLACGYSVGIAGATSQVYLGEISDPKLRGILSGTPFVSYSMGILLVYSLGSLPWRWVAGSAIILPILGLLALCKMPESPQWLARNSRLSRAQAAIAWLRGNDALAKKELHQILTASVKEREQELIRKESFFETIKKPDAMKPFIIINIFNMLQIFSGTYVVIFYAVDIIQVVVGDTVDGLMVAIMSAVVRLVASIIGCFLLYNMNRRTLCIMSGVGSTVASLCLGIYMIARQGETTKIDFWVKAVSLLIYISSNTVGFMMLPGIMVGELLPAKIRGMCGGYIFMFFNISIFVVTKLFPSIISNFGIQGMFFIFGIASLLGTIFMYLVLPETKNRSLFQIENYFQQPNILWRNRNISESTDT